MGKRALIAGWFDSDTKARFAAVARAQELSESALLKRLVSTVLLGPAAGSAAVVDAVPSDKVGARLSVRVRESDFLRLRHRAIARQMPTSSYVTHLIEAHLNPEPPLPSAEFQVLRQSLLAIAALGRNLNQIARAVNAGGRVLPSAPELEAAVRAVMQVREEFRNLLGANLASWRTSPHDRPHN